MAFNDDCVRTSNGRVLLPSSVMLVDYSEGHVYAKHDVKAKTIGKSLAQATNGAAGHARNAPGGRFGMLPDIDIKCVQTKKEGTA